MKKLLLAFILAPSLGLKSSELANPWRKHFQAAIKHNEANQHRDEMESYLKAHQLIYESIKDSQKDFFYKFATVFIAKRFNRLKNVHEVILSQNALDIIKHAEEIEKNK